MDSVRKALWGDEEDAAAVSAAAAAITTPTTAPSLPPPTPSKAVKRTRAEMEAAGAAATATAEESEDEVLFSPEPAAAASTEQQDQYIEDAPLEMLSRPAAAAAAAATSVSAAGRGTGTGAPATPAKVLRMGGAHAPPKPTQVLTCEEVLQVRRQGKDFMQCVDVHNRTLLVLYTKETNKFYCIDALCYHQGQSLALGDIEDCGAPVLRCPAHGKRFRMDGAEVAADGRVLEKFKQRPHTVVHHSTGELKVLLNQVPTRYASDTYQDAPAHGSLQMLSPYPAESGGAPPGTPERCTSLSQTLAPTEVLAAAEAAKVVAAAAAAAKEGGDARAWSTHAEVHGRQVLLAYAGGQFYCVDAVCPQGHTLATMGAGRGAFATCVEEQKLFRMTEGEEVSEDGFIVFNRSVRPHKVSRSGAGAVFVVLSHHAHFLSDNQQPAAAAGAMTPSQLSQGSGGTPPSTPGQSASYHESPMGSAMRARRQVMARSLSLQKALTQ